MTNFTIFIQTLLVICAGIGVIGGAGAVIQKVVMPARILQKKVDDLDNKCTDLKTDLEAITKNTQILLSCTIALLNNSLSGECDTNNLKKIQNQLNEFLIQK